MKIALIYFFIITCKGFADQNHFNVNSDVTDCSNDTIIREIYQKNDAVVHIFEGKNEFYVKTHVEHVNLLWNIEHQLVAANSESGRKFRNYVFYIAVVEDFGKLFKKLLESELWNNEYSQAGIMTIFLTSSNKSEIVSVLGNVLQVQIAKLLLVNLNNCSKFAYNPHRSKINPVKNLVEFKTFQHLNNLQNCTIKVAFTNATFPTPYIDVSEQRPKGLFLNPLHIWASKYNATLQFEELPNTYIKNPASPEAEEYVTDALKMRSMDIMAVHLYFNTAPKDASKSHIIFTDYHVWLVPKSKKLSSLRSIMLIFTPDVWVYILVIYLTFVIGWIVLGKFLGDHWRVGERLLDGLKILLGTGIPVPQAQVLKIWIIFYVIFSYHVNYIFQGKLHSFLTVPRFEGRINTMEKLAKSSLLPYMFIAYKARIPLINHTGLLTTFLKKSLFFRHGNMTNLAETVIRTQRMAAYVLKEDSVITRAHLQYVDMVQDTIMNTMGAVYLFKVGSPLTSSINRVLQTVAEGGLISKWLIDMQKVCFIPDTKKHVVLSFEHTELGFLILISGVIISVFTFIGELVVTKTISSRKALLV